MINLLLIAPIIFPLFFGLLTLGFWKYKKIQQGTNIVASITQLFIGVLLLKTVLEGGIISFQAGGWDAPFGITIVADTFSSIMILVSGIISFTVALYSINSMSLCKITTNMTDLRYQFGYYPLINIMFMGINGAFLAGDLFNMYVWFEVLLISSFILLSLGGSKHQLEASFKYVTINILSSSFFLIGLGFLYALTGTLNMADLAVKIPQIENQSMVTLVSMFFLISFGIKAAVFPLYFWLPSSYHTPPISITAIFAGILTKVGVYALVRVFTLIFVQEISFTHNILLWISGITMLVGVLGAASQYDMRRILSFHIISQIGYMILGLALFSQFALLGVIFFIVHNIFVKSNLLLISGLIHRLKGVWDVRYFGGTLNAYPVLAVLFLISALSLAGIPPLSGFWSKFIVIKAGVDLKQYILVAAALLTGLLTLFSMIKIWNEAFWKPDPNKSISEKSKIKLFQKSNLYMICAIVFLSLLSLFLGFYPSTFYSIAEQAAYELMNPSNYINAVLGGVK